MGGDAEDFVFDTFRDQPDKLPQDVIYDKFREFVREYGANLDVATRDLDESFGDVWDITDPVVLNFAPDSKYTLEETLGTKAKEDPLFYKVMLVCSSVVAEAGDLVDEAHSRLIPSLSTFGEQPDNLDGDSELAFGRMLPMFLDLWTFCDRAYKVVTNIVKQLASIYSDKKRKRTDRKGLAAYQGTHLTAVWTAMLDIMTVLITLDQLILQNDAFHQSATVFRRMMKNARNQPEKYDTDSATAKKFGLLLDKIEADLLDDFIFLRCTEASRFEDLASGISIRDNLTFMHEFDFQMRELLTFVKRGHGISHDIDRRQMYVGLCGMYVMYYSFFREKVRDRSDDKKFFKTLYDIHKTVPLIHLAANSTFQPAEWLGRRVNDMANSVTRDNGKDHASACKAVLSSYDTDLEAQVNKYVQEVMAWSARFESIATTNKTEDVISHKSFMITKGIHFATEISTTAKTVLCLHVALGAALNVKKVLLVCKCIELLKSIRLTFHRKSSELGNLMSIMTEYISFSLTQRIVPFKRKLKEHQAKLDEAQIDQMSAIDLMQRVLYGAPTRSSLIVLNNALCIVTSKTGGFIKVDDFDAMKVYMRKLELLATWQTLLDQACDCSFFYWKRALLPKYFETVFKQPTMAPSLIFMFAALHDPGRVLLCASHLKEKKSLFNAYQKEIETELQEKVVEPLSREIEKTLRLSIHSVVLGQGRHELGQELHKDYQHLLNCPGLRLFGMRINIRDYVQCHLERQFYNLTALHPNDWNTYEEMRALAKEKYNMSLTEAHLPGQILDQGLDILEITRSIHLFVTKYTYNMNSQIFVERPAQTTSKHIHSVHVRHVANSVRTHGTGMMNTTVNFVFRLLRKRFFQFSQFLFDDHVKSRLIKDMKWYHDNREELRNCYPMKRAEKFVKDIRRLGTDGNASYLDRFSELITEIGNGLGYVRMVRTGGMRAISGSIDYVPSLEEIPEFAALLEEANFKKNPDDSDEEVEGEIPESTVKAAQNLDTVLENQSKKFSEGSDYFKLLERVFKEEMNSEKNAHMQNFYAIIPPLTVSFIEHIIANKDGLSKKGRECCFSDDGFAVGVMFILKVLNLTAKFDSLHWFESVQNYYAEESRNVDKQMSDASHAVQKKKDQKQQAGEQQGEITTLNLTANRIRQRTREYELLQFAFRSAKVFFKEKVTCEEEEEDEEDEEDEESLDEA